MATYKTDLRDIKFTLFELFQVEKYMDGYEANDLMEIINQFDKFVEGEVFPTREASDKEGVVLKDKKVTTPDSFKNANAKYHENGWFGLGYPEAIGGMPVPYSIATCCNAIANGANVAWTMYYGLTKGALNLLLELGSEEQKILVADKMMKGIWGGTMCLTEPGAGSDVGAVKTIAKPIGDDEYSISGVKIFISSGDNDLYQNIIHLVLARLPDAPAGTKGLSLFLVPKFKVNDDGSNGDYNHVECTKIEEKMGLHGSSTCELTFGQHGECTGTLVGKNGEGMANMFHMMNDARLLCGVQGEGQANLVTSLTEQYLRERSQFGLELIKMPDVKRMFLKMRSLSRGMRALNLYTSNLFDQVKIDPSVESEIAFLTPICKAYCSDEGFNVAVEAIQCHGGYGYCQEYGIEQFARDTKIARIYEGTNGIQAIDFVMRKIIKEKGKTFIALGKKMGNTIKDNEIEDWRGHVELMVESIKDAEKIMAKFVTEMQAKESEKVLLKATDFLHFCGNLMVSWLLLESAILAKKNLKEGANGDEKTFYESKVQDFLFFCENVLVGNKAHARSILGFDTDPRELMV